MRYLMIVAGLAIGYYVYTHYKKQPIPMDMESTLAAGPSVPAAAPPPVFDEESLEKIRASTTDSDPKVRWEAAKFLANAHDQQADAILINMLRTDDTPELRRDVVALLAGRNDKQFTPYIVLALKDTEVDVRLAALTALGRLGDNSAAPAISEALRDVDERVRLAALKTLNELQTKHNEQVQKIEQQRREYQQELERRRKEEQEKRR